MCKNKAFLRLMLICICVTMVVGCLSLGALAATNPVLQVNRVGSSASFEDGSIQVSLARDDVFTYNEILDLSAATKDVRLLDLKFDPTVVGTADATRVKIRLTDLYDESNYITISLNNISASWASGHMYVTAGAADQPQVGVEHNPKGAVVHKDSEYGYGCAVDYSMVGMPKEENHTSLTLYYDHNEKAFYADRETYSTVKNLIVDLDNPDHFGEELWEGFTTGHVKMTVFATNYQADTCNFTISTIAGKSNFQDNGDQSAPVIFIDSGYAADQLPTALVGKAYPIFDAKAIDGCEGEIAYTVAVRNQSTSKAVSVVDGKFTPTEEGVYVIKYTAKDSAGNTATKSVKVNATTGEGLQVTLQDVVSATDTGVAVKLFSGVSSTDASGNVAYSVTAKDPVTGEVLEVDPQTLTFTPMSTGAWEITVTVKDHVSTVVKTFTVTANATTQPRVYDEVAVPKYFIKGASYTLPVLYAYDFSSGTGVATAMDVYVSGTKITGQYKPSSTGSVTVTYQLTVDGNTCKKTYNATVVDVESWLVGRLDMRQFFYGNASKSGNSSSISYKSSTDNTTLEFLNLVQVKDLTFSFKVGSSNANKKVNIYLTDPADSNKQVKLTYSRMADGKAAFCVNDGPLTLLSSNFDGTSFPLRFSADTCRVSPEAGVTLKVKEFTDGSAFTGFTGSVARFSVQMAEVTSETQLVITALNAQSLYYSYGTEKDSVAPQLFYEVPGDQKPGAEVTIPGVLVHDVLNPVATATLTVKNPNGSVLLNAVDATKDYTFTANTCGEYTVSYTVEDGEGNDATHTYTISVNDGIGPEITLPENRTDLVAPGTTVTIATAQVSDNSTALCYVFGPDGDSVAVTDGTFVAETAGTYTVRYMAVDGDGNYGFASYAVTAEEDAVSTTSYISQSVSLGSEVALNLWGNVPEAYRNSLSGVLAYDNMKQSFSLSQMSPAANGLYNIQAKLAMGQMTEKIDLTVRHPVFAESYYKSYTIRNYLTALLEGNFDQDTKDLCLELMNLGAWAQKYFKYRTYDMVNEGYEISPANTMAEEAPQVSVNGNVDGVSFYGTTVVYLSKATVRFYFKAPGGIDDYTFTVDGVQYTPVYKSGLYYIETPGINPQDMAKKFDVQVTDGTSTLSFQYAPIWYFIRTYHKSTDETTRGLMEAAYSYYKEAEAYVASPSGSVETPEAPSGEGTYICLDVLITTSDNSTEEIEIGFYPENFEGSINTYTNSVTVTAGTTTTVKLPAESYMLDDNAIPNTLGVAVLGGPEDGSGNTHTLKISNIRVEGELNRELDLNNVKVSSGTNGTGFEDATDFGKASVVDGAIVIEGGVCNDGHKITLLGKTNTVISLDVLITTSGDWTDPIDVRFYRYDYEGKVHESYTDLITVEAGKETTVKLDLNKYLVNGELPGIGFAVFGGPEWNDANGDTHTLTVSNIHLEGDLTTGYDLSQSTWKKGQEGTGYTDANGFGQATIGSSIVITGGVRYDGHKITLVEEPDTYICLDMHFATTGEWTDPVEIGFFPYNFEGDINNKTDKLFVTAGKDFTVKLDLDKYLVDGELPGIGFVIFGGPTHEGTDRHTVTVSNIRLEGDREQEYETVIASVNTGFANSNSGGTATVADGTITVTGGFRYDGHMITFGAEEEPETTAPETTVPETTEPETTEPPVEEFDTSLCLDMQIDTLSGTWEKDIEIRFYAYDFEGNPHEVYTDSVIFKAGEKQTVKLDAEKYLVDGKLTGIGIGIFGGPEWDTLISEGVYDRHTVTISSVKLEGEQSAVYDLSQSTVASGTNGTGFTESVFGPGAVTIGDSIVLADGHQYFAHKISLVEDTRTFLCMDMLFTTTGEWTDPVNICFYRYDYEGSVYSGYTDAVAVIAGTTTTVKLDISKYLVDGELPGIVFGVHGGPEWNTQISDGVYNRHSITISNARLEGYQSKVFDLSRSTWAGGNNGTGFTNANGSGAATIGESIVITNGFRYDGHKISLVEDSCTDICLDMLITTLGGSTDPVEVRFFPYNYTGSVGDGYTDQIYITAGTATTVKLDLDDYLVDGELTGIGFAIMGGPAFDTTLSDGTYDRHTVTISNARLEGVQAKVFDLSKSTWTKGQNAGYSWANDSGAATIGESIVITNGFRYDGHKITLVEDTRTFLCMDMLFGTLGDWTDPVEIGFYPYNFEGAIDQNWTEKITVTAGTASAIKLNVEKYLVDGELPGIGFVIFGGPEWNTQISDGVYNRHTITISNARLEGYQSKAYDLSQSTWASAANAGYSGANGSGAATIGETIVITNGFRYDGHKISLVEDTNTYLCMDLLLTTLGGSTDPVEIRLFNYNYAASVGDGYTNQIYVTAGTTAKIKVKVDQYLVDGELPGFGFAIMGGPTWETKLPDGYTPDRHSITISNARLEGVEARSIDLSGATVATGTNGTGFTWANGNGQASIVDGEIVITDGFQYDAHEITF